MSHKPFDPFTATLDEAMAQPNAFEVRGAVWRCAGAQELAHRREFYERNPLDGIAVCAVHDLVAPEWLAKAFLRGFYAVRNCLVGSWDEAFGSPFPKGAQVAALRRRREARVRVANVVTEFVKRHPDESVQSLYDASGATGKDKLDDHIGDFAARLGVGKTEAQRLFAEAVQLGMAHPIPALRARLGAPSRPAPAKLRKLAGVRRKRK